MTEIYFYTDVLGEGMILPDSFGTPKRAIKRRAIFKLCLFSEAVRFLLGRLVLLACPCVCYFLPSVCSAAPPSLISNSSLFPRVKQPTHIQGRG